MGHVNPAECVSIVAEESYDTRELHVYASVGVPPCQHLFKIPESAYRLQPELLEAAMEEQLRKLLTEVTSRIVTEYKEKANEIHRQAQRW